MKRYALIGVFIFLLVAIVGCNANNSTITPTSGTYYVTGDYEEDLTPYLWLDTKDNTFALGSGSVVSYAERGSFEIKDEKLIATSQNTTFVFEIKDKKTLVLIDNGDNEFFKLPNNAEFVYNDKLR